MIWLSIAVGMIWGGGVLLLVILDVRGESCHCVAARSGVFSACSCGKCGAASRWLAERDSVAVECNEEGAEPLTGSGS